MGNSWRKHRIFAWLRKNAVGLIAIVFAASAAWYARVQAQAGVAAVRPVMDLSLDAILLADSRIILHATVKNGGKSSAFMDGLRWVLAREADTTYSLAFLSSKTLVKPGEETTATLIVVPKPLAGNRTVDLARLERLDLWIAYKGRELEGYDFAETLSVPINWHSGEIRKRQ